MDAQSRRGFPIGGGSLLRDEPPVFVQSATLTTSQDAARALNLSFDYAPPAALRCTRHNRSIAIIDTPIMLGRLLRSMKCRLKP